MSETPKCPQCGSENPYQDRAQWVCPDCAHEWSENAAAAPIAVDGAFRDANGNILVMGDTVALIKDLKVKGSSSSVKNGTKVKNIRLLTELVDGHNIACKIDGLGTIYLKSEFVRKA